MFDDSLLDRPGALARADAAGLLRTAAGAGARVRLAAHLAAEAGTGALRPDGRPRTVLVAGPGPTTGHVTAVLAALAGCPVLPLPSGGPEPTPDARTWTLPGWTGGADLLLVATPDGTEPGLARLAEQAYRRGASLAGVAPARSPLTEALQQARGFALPCAPAPDGAPGAPGHDAGAFWSLLTPLLALTDRTGLLEADPAAVDALADRLDTAAVRFGPATAAYDNPAKTLATALADHLPLLWSHGPVGHAVATRLAGLLTARAGRPALAAPLPDALTEHAALLDTRHGAGAGLDDFFRDRVEDPGTPSPRVVLLPEPGDHSCHRALDAARAAADRTGTPVTAPEPPAGTRTEALAELLALADFTAAYLAIDPADDAG